MKCNKCEKDKPETEFYPRNRVCKPCYKERVARYQANEGRERHQEANKRYAATARGREVNSAALLTYVGNNPKKRRAKDAVKRAKKRGQLTPSPCEVCGSEIVHAHHDDYNRPLEVRWLCSRHHREWHRLNGEGKNPE